MYTVGYHDEPGSAPFIVAAVALMDGLVDISSYWVFSDVFEVRGTWPLKQTPKHLPLPALAAL
jgi:hypothetical protein